MKMVMRKRKRGILQFFCGIPVQKSFLGEFNGSSLLEDLEEDEEEKRTDLDNYDASSVDSSFNFSFREYDTNTRDKQLQHTLLCLNLEIGCSQAQDFVSYSRIDSIEPHIFPPFNSHLFRFDYEEIRLATLNFSQDRVLGKGAHSYVYKGRLWHGKSIAVKSLKVEMKDACKDFCRELYIASKLHHHNVVPLIGFCIDSRGLFLVYKFVAGGSLQAHLHERAGTECMPWSARFRAAKGIAKALTYLHGHGRSYRCIVHRDIKPSNVLLTSTKSAKLCDFGLATMTRGANTPIICKSAKGTFGYLAPEYFQNGKVSSKTDIYAYGVLLLELLTGRKPIQDQKNLVIWASPKLSKGSNIDDLIDWRLHGHYNVDQAQRLILAAYSCLNPTDSFRKPMPEILSLVKGGAGSCNSLNTGFSANGELLLPWHSPAPLKFEVG